MLAHRVAMLVAALVALEPDGTLYYLYRINLLDGVPAYLENRIFRNSNIVESFVASLQKFLNEIP